MSEKREALGALGLCARAGKLIYGIPMICERFFLRSRQAVPVF